MGSGNAPGARLARPCCAGATSERHSRLGRRPRPTKRSTPLLLLLALAGCDSFDYEGFLSKPIPILLTQDTPVIPVLFGESGFDAVIDTNSPLTALALGSGGVTDGDLRLQHGTQPTISRFIFFDFPVHDLLAPLSLGLDQPFDVKGIVGASLLQHFAVELDYSPTPQLTFSDEIPDSKAELASECDSSKLVDPVQAIGEHCQATFSAPVVGGGLAGINGGKLFDLPATRLVLSLCLQPNVFDPTLLRGHGAESQSGVPVIAVVATGMGTSVVTRSAFQRLQARDTTLAASGGSTLYLGDGQQSVSTVTLDRVSVVSNETSELNSCGELALRRRFLIASSVPLSEKDLKLVDEKKVDGASTATVTSGVRFVVLDDEAPLIQGLRKELAPHVADIDVVLGGSFLRHFNLRLGYPSDRVVLRCSPAAAAAGGCQVLPWCGQHKDITPRCPGLPD